ncbi:hypothetical protein F2P79_011712 [Pimephales promelas]|nr:hypothetical protein F2P79_011712 [Pimephales promelas]
MREETEFLLYGIAISRYQDSLRIEQNKSLWGYADTRLHDEKFGLEKEYPRCNYATENLQEDRNPLTTERCRVTLPHRA